MEAIDDLSLPEKRLCMCASEQLIPINGILELTPVCNMNCDMCYVRLSNQEMKEKGPIRSLEDWLHIAEQLSQAGTLFLLLTGGEPLLYPQFKELYLALKHMGMILTVNTNGTLINEEWAEFFAQHKPRRINITLYGTSAEEYLTLCHNKDGYEKTLRAIALLTERGVDVKINGSLTNYNKKNGVQILKTANQLKVPCKIDTYMYPAKRERQSEFQKSVRMSAAEAARIRVDLMKARRTEEKFREYIQEYLGRMNSGISVADTHMQCQAGKCSFMINWQGNVSFCVFMSDYSVSAFEKDFQYAWKSITDYVKKVRMPLACTECGYREVCQVCAACTKLETGAFDGVPEYMCEYTKETVRLLQEYRDNNRV